MPPGDLSSFADVKAGCNLLTEKDEWALESPACWGSGEKGVELTEEMGNPGESKGSGLLGLSTP